MSTSTFSAFFSAGLQYTRAYTPPTDIDTTLNIDATAPSSPIDIDIALPSSPVDAIDPLTAPPSPTTITTTTTIAERSNTRKRRSSLSLTTVRLKSPGAGVARRRQVAQARSRSGSLTTTTAPVIGGVVATEGNSLVGRIRSGSFGGVRPRRFIRRLPATPPPTAALPAIPQSPVTPQKPDASFFHSSLPSTKPSGADAEFLGPDFTDELLVAMGSVPTVDAAVVNEG